MNLEEMEATIQKIVDDCDHDRGRPDNAHSIRGRMIWKISIERKGFTP